MSDERDAPSADLAYGLYTGGVKAQLVRLSLLLGVYAPLADGPATAAQVAERCGSDPDGTALLLDYLAANAVVRREGNSFALTPTAAAFLVPPSPAYAGDVMLTFTRPET